MSGLVNLSKILKNNINLNIANVANKNKFCQTAKQSTFSD